MRRAYEQTARCALAIAGPADPAGSAGRVLVCRGGSDPHVPIPDVTALCAEMTAARADWQFKVYGGSQHGFAHRTATTSTDGVAYDPVTDERSFDDITALLRTVLA